MKNLGSQTLHHIEKLLTTKKKSPTRQTNTSTSPNKQRASPQKSRSPTLYQPMEKDNAIMHRQLRLIHQQMENQNNYRVQNRHSYFLNSKNPKPPLYLRTQEILRERELWLEGQKQLKEEERKAKQEEEFRQFLEISVPERKIPKNEALQLTDRLYKEHYNKASRMNDKKMQRLKYEAQHYRNRPQLNSNTQQIFRVVSERNELQKDVVSRFQQYSDTKYQREAEYEQLYRNHYYPFKPKINQQSRLIASKNDDSRAELSRSKHCVSCTAIKLNKSSLSLIKSNRLNKMKSSLESDCKDFNMIVSKFQ